MDMASEKYVQMLKALKKGTEEKRLHWEDLPDEDMFRAQAGGGLVRIGPAGDQDRKGYTLWLIGHGGTIAAEVNFFQGDAGFEAIEEVYSTARLAARGGDRMIDQIIAMYATS